MRPRHLLLPVLLLGPATGLTAQAPAPRVILFIGDGVGVSYWSAALLAAESLAIRTFPVAGLVDTRNVNDEITDSAAGATVYAAGVRTYNGAIGLAADSTPVETVLEMAHRRRMATGLIATSRFTHATPASFAAHVVDRSMEWEIGKQIVEHDVTVVLGGGSVILDPTQRPDSLDLLSRVRRRYVYVETPAALRALNLDTVRTLFGMFDPSHMPAALPRAMVSDTAPHDTTWTPARSPTLGEMTAAALAVLDHDPEGFFLMVEASQPDWRGHSNEPLEAVQAEMLDFDDAVRVALDYRRRYPETLIVVTADHETGGLALQEDSTRTVIAGYTSEGHTGELVPLFAVGPESPRFGGVIRNDRVGELLIEALTGNAVGTPAIGRVD